MITNRSKKREIRDLQRLLVSLGYLTAPTGEDKGWWSAETQEAVVTAYKMIGWDHPRSRCPAGHHKRGSYAWAPPPRDRTGHQPEEAVLGRGWFAG